MLEIGGAARSAPPELAEQLERSQETARSSLEELQRIVRELRPEALDDLGLASALAVLSDRVSEQTGLRIVREFDPDPVALGPDEELVVYRIAQEGLTNAVRHAAATEAELKLECTPMATVLTVRDNGCGLDGRLTPGKGIRGMRERALLIGAELSVESPPGRGVEIRLMLPNEVARA
jgi:two-component system sensor histidine kinase UhpB